MEIERQKRVLDMMITAHSILRDRYYRLSLVFDLTLLVLSVILNALVFVDTVFISQQAGITADQQRIITGIASVAVFAISVILLQVNWKEKASGHERAAEQLFVLLQESRSIMDMVEGDNRKLTLVEFSKKYTQLSGMIPKIPDKKFNSLKLRHYKKVELSKLIDKYPGSPMILLKGRLLWSSFKNKTNGN